MAVQFWFSARDCAAILDLPGVWVSNAIEFLSTEKVWAYLFQHPNPG
jgi:hypothetical protein